MRGTHRTEAPGLREGKPLRSQVTRSGSGPFAKPEGEPVNVLTHCNAGWLATVDWGTAMAPLYLAHEEGIPVHVWVDEDGPVCSVRIVAEGSPVPTPAFDVTPAELVTALITERGMVPATREGLAAAFPDRAGGEELRPRRVEVQTTRS